MIKRFVSGFVVVCGGTVLLAQTAPVQAPQTYPPQTYPSSSYPNQPPPGFAGPAFSNGAGQNFTPQQLAAQLQNLRSIVDQTLPVLGAFNAQSSNSVSGTRPSAGSELSGIVSDVLHRNQPAGQNSAGQNAFSATNLLAVLHGLLNTNSTGAVGASVANSQDLIALQNDLQAVELVLQRLNVSPGPTTMTTPYPQPYPGANVSPTGR